MILEMEKVITVHILSEDVFSLEQHAAMNRVGYVNDSSHALRHQRSDNQLEGVLCAAEMRCSGETRTLFH